MGRRRPGNRNGPKQKKPPIKGSSFCFLTHEPPLVWISHRSSRAAPAGRFRISCFRSGGCPPRRRLGLPLRAGRTRLCRMGTRRRQFARRRFRAYLRGARRSRSVTCFRAIRISLRKVMSVMHFHALRYQPRRAGSVGHDRGFTRGFRRSPLLVHGASTLLPCFRKNGAACREEDSHASYVFRRFFCFQPKPSTVSPTV